MKQFTGQLIRQLYNSFETWRNHANSRKQAESIQKQIVSKKGYSVVNKELRKKIRKYAEKRFGDRGYSAWLETYTELKEEFKEGWVPDDYYTFEMIPVLNSRNIAALSNYKSFDHRLFPGFAIDPLFVKINGQFYDYSQRTVTSEEMIDKLREYNDEIVIKLDSAPSGKGVFFKQSGLAVSNDFQAYDNFLIQPSLKQHVILNELYPHSLNTLRVTTFVGRAGETSVKHLSLRFGRFGNRIANVSAGGLSVYVDSDGNVVSDAVDEIGLNSGHKHVDTSYIYKNLKVPGVPEAINKCKKAHRLFPYLKFIAWDLFIDEYETPGLIEWNAWMPDMWVNEALIGPLWPDYEF